MWIPKDFVFGMLERRGELGLIGAGVGVQKM
jgi:hypothetical protein